MPLNVLSILRAGCVVLALLVSSTTFAFDHSGWDRLLSAHVKPAGNGAATALDYAGIKGERAALKEYLDALADIDTATFDGWSRDEQLAFLINAYNAWTVELVLTRYPDLDSIRDLGSFFSSPWKKDIARLFGDKVSLDHIEHTLIRGSGRYNEPRIHFAVNCASVGCPALAEAAFTADALDAQLDAATRRFLSDRTRNRWRDGALEVSSIFKWYRDDFESGWRGADTLGSFLALYSDALSLTDAQTARARSDAADIDFLSYDWSLNDTQ